MTNVLVCGGAHADRRGRIAGHTVPGASNPGAWFSEAGGGGFNAARNLARLGHAVTLISPRGGDVTSGDGTLFFRPQDVVLVSDPAMPGLEGRVSTSRRLAGTRIADIDVGRPGEPHHVEIEVPLDAEHRHDLEAMFSVGF